MEDFTLHSIPEAIEDIRNGKLTIVVDDENRENEGDFITAARNVQLPRSSILWLRMGVD